MGQFKRFLACNKTHINYYRNYVFGLCTCASKKWNDNNHSYIALEEIVSWKKISVILINL